MRTFFVLSILVINFLGLRVNLLLAKDGAHQSVEMVAYPNPISVGETLNIDVNGLDKQINYSPTYISIYSIIGTKVFEKFVEPTENFRVQLMINKSFASNIYFITLANKDIHITKKLLINN